MTKILKISLFMLFPIILAEIGRTYKKEGPRGMPLNKTTSCPEFGKNARFNPYSIVGDQWFVFYYWATPRPAMVYKFRAPTKKEKSYLQDLLDTHVKQFNWSVPMVLMEDQIDKSTSLLVERGRRGQYWIYMLETGLPLGKLARRYEIRIKQTGDNKYIGAMDCKTRTAFIMSRITEVPPKAKLQEEASKLGYIGRKGKSYLYQGHEWMPIPEADEKSYWDLMAGRKPDIERWYQ